MCHSLLVMAFVYRLFRNFYTKYFPDFGVVFMVLTLFYFFRKKARTMIRVSKLMYLDKKDLAMTRRGRNQLIWLAAGLAILLLVPWTRRTIAAEAFLKPLAEVTVQAPEDGIVAEVLAQEGDLVEKGQPLLRVTSPNLDAETERSQSERDRYARKSSGDRSSANASMMFQSESRASAAQTAVETAKYRQGFLTIRSPIRGRVITPRMQDLEGRFVAVGYPLARIGDCRSMAAEIPVSERLLEYLKVGAPVAAQIGTRPTRIYAGSVARISPATLRQPTTATGIDVPAPSTDPD